MPGTSTPAQAPDPVDTGPADDLETDAAAAPDAAAPAPEAAVDGRSARAERTRQAIVDALLSLLEAGDLQPTATRIAERAGISLRLIYHHFGDLESLFRATAVRQAERSRALAVEVDPDLPLPARIESFCTQRTRVLESMTPIRRAALLHEPFSPELQRARDGFMRAADRQLVRVFHTELEAFDEPARAQVRSALGAATSWSTWDVLRSSGLDEADALVVVQRMVGALLRPDV
jgi:AcrR family transcriptional regulator